MNKSLLGTASALAALALLAGCSNTLNGAQQDASKDTQAVGSAANNAAAATKQDVAQVGSDVKKTAADAKAATVLTPLIKTAIIRDPILNDARNQINVTTEATVVHLRGHVTDAGMKARAEEDTQKVLTDHHGPQTISDELTVSGAGA